MKRPSVRDVALAAGVSISSVSRVLNGHLSVRPDIAAKVLYAAREMGYQPDANARGLRMGVSKTIGCLIPDIANALYASYVSAIEARLQEEGYMLLLGSSRGQVSRERELIRLFESRSMDGMIVATVSEGNPEVCEILRRCSVPVVVVDRDIDDEFDAALICQRRLNSDPPCGGNVGVNLTHPTPVRFSSSMPCRAGPAPLGACLSVASSRP